MGTIGWQLLPSGWEIEDPNSIEGYNINVCRIMIFSITAFTAHTGEEIWLWGCSGA